MDKGEIRNLTNADSIPTAVPGAHRLRHSPRERHDFNLAFEILVACLARHSRNFYESIEWHGPNLSEATSLARWRGLACEKSEETGTHGCVPVLERWLNPG